MTTLFNFDGKHASIPLLYMAGEDAFYTYYGFTGNEGPFNLYPDILIADAPVADLKTAEILRPGYDPMDQDILVLDIACTCIAFSHSGTGGQGAPYKYSNFGVGNGFRLLRPNLDNRQITPTLAAWFLSVGILPNKVFYMQARLVRDARSSIDVSSGAWRVEGSQ
jgi:hypothetical protein